MKRKSLSKRVRFEVFKRDSFRCQYCGKSAPEVILHVDHIIPHSKGGKDTALNLVTSCQDCNLGKSNNEISDTSAISKAKIQADLLQERRNQIELMGRWYSEMESQKDAEADIIQGIISSHSKLTLSDAGRRHVKAAIKKYGLALVAEKAGEAFESNPSDADDFERCIKRLDKALKWNSAPIHVQKSHYITGVIRNRFYGSYEWQACFRSLLLMVLEEFPEEHPEFYRIAAKSEDLPSARDEMIQYSVELGIPESLIHQTWNNP